MSERSEHVGVAHFQMCCAFGRAAPVQFNPIGQACPPIKGCACAAPPSLCSWHPLKWMPEELSGNNKFQQFSTPDFITNDFIAHVESLIPSKERKFYDLGAGNGRLSAALLHKGYRGEGVELDPRCGLRLVAEAYCGRYQAIFGDVTRCFERVTGPQRKHDFVVSNPPFRRVDEFIVAGMELSNTLFFIIPTNVLYKTTEFCGARGYGLMPLKPYDFPLPNTQDWHSEREGLVAVHSVMVYNKNNELHHRAGKTAFPVRKGEPVGNGPCYLSGDGFVPGKTVGVTFENAEAASAWGERELATAVACCKDKQCEVCTGFSERTFDDEDLSPIPAQIAQQKTPAQFRHKSQRHSKVPDQNWCVNSPRSLFDEREPGLPGYRFVRTEKVFLDNKPVGYRSWYFGSTGHACSPTHLSCLTARRPLVLPAVGQLDSLTFTSSVLVFRFEGPSLHYRPQARAVRFDPGPHFSEADFQAICGKWK